MSSNGNIPSKKAAAKKKKKVVAISGSAKKSSGKKKGNKKEAKDKEFYSKQAGDDFEESADNNSSCDEDYSDDGDEGCDGYKPGGYHPVNIGDKFNANRFTVIEKLGWGHFSTVWMTFDKRAQQSNKPEFVALKVQKSAPHYREAAIDEIELLNCVSSTLQSEIVVKEFGTGFDPCIVTLFDAFDHVGPNGKHMCMTFEILGENLLKVIKRYDYQGIPIPIVKNFVRQICVGLDFLHRHCSIIHTDLKPENILISAPPPTPDMVEVRALVAGTSTASASKKSKSGHQQSSQQQQQSVGGISNGDHLTGAEDKAGGSSEKPLTAEQKKRLKKKMKKKRQIARKNEKKRGGGGRRSKPCGKSGADTTVLKEMIMMELGSIPSSMSSAVTADMVANVAKSYSDVFRSGGSGSGGPAMNDDDDDDVDLGDESSRQQVLAGNNESASLHRISAGLQLPTVSNDPDETDAFPAWQRPTLFSYLNIATHPSDVSLSGSLLEGMNGLSVDEPKTQIAFAGAEPILEAAYVSPSPKEYTRISMVVAPEKMFAAFGHYTNKGSHGSSASQLSQYFADINAPSWFFSLKPSNQHTSDHCDGVKNLFTVRRIDDDVSGVASLAAYCMLNALIFEPEKYSVLLPVDPDTRPVVWEIEHYQGMTHHVLAYLESALPGVFFMVHLNSGLTSIIDDDDAELYFLMKNYSTTPALDDEDFIVESEQYSKQHLDWDQVDEKEAKGSFVGADVKGGVSLDSKDGQSQSKDEYSASFGGKSSYRHNSVKLMGIDIDLVSRCVAVIESQVSSSTGEALDDGSFEVCYPYDLTGFVRPLAERMRSYSGGSDYISQLIDGYKHIRRISTACGYDSQDDSLAEDLDDKDGGYGDAVVGSGTQRRKSTHEDLDAAYVNAKIKIVDLGNACWTHKHFTDDIQTRQYRAPEVIIASEYDTSADIWSLACIIFELLTGDLLFDPHSGKSWDREEDHLAMIMELLGPFPKDLLSTGKISDRYFTKRGELKHIQQLKMWGLQDVLREKYRFTEEESAEIADFLTPMLLIDPRRRVTAQDSLRHPWLNSVHPSAAGPSVV